MIAGTHIAFATSLYLGGAALFEYPPDLIGWGLAAAASLLPDIDLPTARLGRVLFFISTRLERAFGHRTLTHSFAALALVAALASFLYPSHPNDFWAVVGGYWSHLWIDMLNLRGADLLWPSPVRVVFPGNPSHRMEVGSKAERVLLIALVLFSLLLYPVSGLGLRTGLQHLLGNFEMAREGFLKHAGQHWYRLRLEATDNLTLEPIRCDCQVVGPWRGGLIVLRDGELRAVGESPERHNLYPTHAELITGEPLRVVSHRVDLRGRSLGWLIERPDPRRTHYLSGELRLGGRATAPIEDLERYRPATLSGQRLLLHYARADHLAPYRGLTAAEGEVFVQYWLKPGDDPVELAVSGRGDPPGSPRS